MHPCSFPGCEASFPSAFNRRRHELSLHGIVDGTVQKTIFHTLDEYRQFVVTLPPFVMRGAVQLSAAAAPLGDGEDRGDLSRWRVGDANAAGAKWVGRVYYMCNRGAPQTSAQRATTDRLVGLTSGAESEAHGVNASFEDDDNRQRAGKRRNSRVVRV